MTKTGPDPGNRLKLKKLNFFEIRQNSVPEKIYEVHLILIFHIFAKKGQKKRGPAWFWPRP